MDRRRFFRFLPAVPVGIVGAAIAKEPDNNVVRASPGQRCQCGCPTYYSVPKIEPHFFASEVGHQHWVGALAYNTTVAKAVCAWCGADWNTKGPYKGA